ncbi:winged helix-turn-helix domain-containing protein [Psychrobacter pygoscelis]|uniref:winged helix-turn-helix domain-containing protein n=1 Tax=Psychrobacter pygoscelis TaxID=2488563 RepID=UPI00103F75D4|nr:winged helix-turn-helix domain-containing protein [Psychrobacter pygoscelis]
MSTTPHILLVEDDPAIATSLKITFKREGWQLTWLDNASAVLPTLRTLMSSATALTGIILDVGLPDGDGLSLCQQIRHSKDIGSQADLPILFLTARSDEVDRILGLEMGADDYCAKPFSPRELVARLKAIWRREQLIAQAQPEANTETANEPQQFDSPYGSWQYEPMDYSLHWQGQKLELSNTERKLLMALLSAPKQVFSREQLLEAISDYPDHRLARTIDSHIKSIRKLLAKIDADTEVIHTHRGLGYSLSPA